MKKIFFLLFTALNAVALQAQTASDALRYSYIPQYGGTARTVGVGGAMALGCTIGQGVTGLSTLAIGSIITTAALVIGGLQGLRYLERSLD